MNFKDIKILVVDVDGTLTDGTYYVSDNGSITKGFNTKDFWALGEIQNAGIKVLLLTGSIDGVIIEKVSRLPKYCTANLAVEHGVENKAKYIEEHLRDCNMDWFNVAYIGDGGNDLFAMQKSAFTACPNDALSMIKNESVYISHLPGGRGAVCEIAMYILSKVEEESE